MTNGHKETQKGSWYSNIQPMEVFLLIMGIVLLVYGISNGQEVVIFFGVVVIPGVFVLRAVRRKDWAKHWEELEAEQKLRADYEAHKKIVAEEARKAAADGK
jgi:hypothetical protein